MHKNNTVFFEGNRYSVPLGTYKPDLEVALRVEEGALIITDVFGDIEYARHPICQEKGKLVKNTNHKRDHSAKISEQYQELCQMLGGSGEAIDFLHKIRKLKSRYVRDQYNLIKKTIQTKPTQAIGQALAYCLKNQLYSAVDFKDAAEYFSGAPDPKEPSVIKETGKVIPILTVKAQKRNIREYAGLIGGEPR